MTQELQDGTNNISKFIFEYWRDLKWEKYLFMNEVDPACSHLLEQHLRFSVLACTTVESF